MAGAPDGNQNALKFDTPEARAALLKAYITHCQQGYPDGAFTMCSYKTFLEYVKNYPIEFPTDLIDEAHASRERFWFDAGMRGSLGIPIEYKVEVDGKIVTRQGKGFNAKSWQFIMMNMFRGKYKLREDVTSDDKPAMPHVIMYKPKKLPANYDEVPPQIPPKPPTAN